MLLRMKILIFWGFTEKSNFQGGGFAKTNIEMGDCLKRWAWKVFRFKGGLARKRGMVFLRGEGLILQCTLWHTHTQKHTHTHTHTYTHTLTHMIAVTTSTSRTAIFGLFYSGCYSCKYYHIYFDIFRTSTAFCFNCESIICTLFANTESEHKQPSFFNFLHLLSVLDMTVFLFFPLDKRCKMMTVPLWFQRLY